MQADRNVKEKISLTMSVKAAIMSEMHKIALEQEKELVPLSDDLMLVDSGFDSLCFAVLVARLEDRLGLDPFARDDNSTFPLTFSDLVRAYEIAGADAVA